MKKIFVIFILLLLSACSSKPYVIKHTEGNVAVKSVEIYVVNHGWHTGFIVPAEKIKSNLPELKERFENTPFIEFGWGDKEFYQAKEITTGLTLRAIFWPTESVIHAVGIPENPDIYFSNSQVEKLRISATGYFSLVRFIENSFYKNEKGNIVTLKSGIYGNSQFYQGEGDFYLMNTCNKWTAKGLKSAGMDISPTFKLTAGSVMNWLGKHNNTQAKTSNRQAVSLLRPAEQ